MSVVVAVLSVVVLVVVSAVEVAVAVVVEPVVVVVFVVVSAVTLVVLVVAVVSVVAVVTGTPCSCCGKVVITGALRVASASFKSRATSSATNARISSRVGGGGLLQRMMRLPTALRPWRLPLGLPVQALLARILQILLFRVKKFSDKTGVFHSCHFLCGAFFPFFGLYFFQKS